MPVMFSEHGAPSTFDLYRDALDEGVGPQTVDVTYDLAEVPDGCGPEAIWASKWADEDHIICMVTGGGHTVTFGSDRVAGTSPATDTLSLPSYLPPASGAWEGLAEYVLGCRGGSCTLTWGFAMYPEDPPTPVPVTVHVHYADTCIEWGDSRWGHTPYDRRGVGAAGTDGRAVVLRGSH